MFIAFVAVGNGKSGENSDNAPCSAMASFPSSLSRSPPAHRRQAGAGRRRAHPRLIADMLETMYDANGIGLAATQVDVHERWS
jgi:hypothetical protein